MVAIKGLSMPNECYYCPLLDGEYGTCNIIGETKVDMTTERSKNCPLVEIGTCKDCKHLGVMDCGYYCKLNHWGKISKESNYGGMGDFYCSDFERRE